MLDNRVQQRQKLRQEAEHLRRLRGHAQVITRAWVGSKQRDALNARFKLRRRMLSVMRALNEHARMADEDRDARIHIFEQQKTAAQRLLESRIAASWRQGSDAHGRNYYFNYVTGESTYVPPRPSILNY